MSQEKHTQNVPGAAERGPSPVCIRNESLQPGKKESEVPSITDNEVNIIPQVQIEPAPDGGYGWVCATAAAVINAHSWGFNSAYAVFLAYYLKNDVFPGGSPLVYAFVGSLSIAFLLLVSPIATMAVGKVGIRKTMFCGAVLEAASFVCASFATHIWHLFLTQGVLFGMGLGLLFIPTAAVVPQWFTRRRSLASGISLCGAAAGGAVYSLAAGAMIENLGLNWTFRTFGIMAFIVNTTCIILIKDRNKAIGSNQSAFQVSLFRRMEYCLLIGWSGFTMLGYFVLIFTLANYANVIGLNSSQAASVSALFNLGQAIGRPLIGYFSDTTGRMNMAASMTFLAGLFPLVIWTFSKNYGVLVFFAIIEGLVAGNFWATSGPLMAEVLGLRDTAAGLSLMWLSMVLPSTFSEPIALEIFTNTGSYIGTQLFTGFVYIAAAICMTLLRGWKLGQEEVHPQSETGPRSVQRPQQVGLGVMLCRCLRWETL